MGQDLQESLQGAVISNDHARVKALIEAGADVNATPSRSSYSALVMAIYRFDFEMVELLLSAGATLPGPPELGPQTDKILADIAFHALCRPAILARLINEGLPVDCQNGSRDTLLTAAVRYRYAEAIPILVKAGMDINAQDGNGDTPLSLAAGMDTSFEALEALLKCGANPDCPNVAQETPLHVAASSGNVKAIRALVEANADKEAQTRIGRTPLQVAVRYGTHGCAEALLAAGANPDHADSKGESALRLAIRRADDTIMATVLLQGGADPNLNLSPVQETLLEMAIRYNRPAIRAALENWMLRPKGEKNDETPQLRKGRRL